MSKRITIKEIAKLSNVSIGTVDRVLHNRGRVAESTRDKILKIAEEGSYSSNVYARNLRLNRTYNIVVVLPMLNAYWEKISKGIHEGVKELSSMGFLCKEYIMDGQRESVMAETVNDVLSAKPDAIILAPNLLRKDSLSAQRLVAGDMPYVFVDSNLENVEKLTFIGQNAFQSGVMAGRLLSKSYSSDYCIYVVTFESKELLNNTIIQRVEGLKHFYDTRADIKVSVVNLENDKLSLNDLKQMFLECSKPVHVLVSNSNSYKLEEQIRDIRTEVRLRLVGYDLIEHNKASLIDGVTDYIIDQKPNIQGRLAVESLYKHMVLKNDVDKEQYLPIEIITKENLIKTV